MNDDRYQRLNADLGLSFNQFAVRNLDWPVAEGIPEGATVLFQIGDPGFDAWSRQVGAYTRRLPLPESHVVFVRVLDPAASPEAIDWSRATIVDTTLQREAV